ncbi:MAG: pilin [Patescibacteria group bacterium]|jgi:hypothetical protein
MKKYKHLVFLFSVFCFLFSVNICSAAIIDGLICATDTTGASNCSLNDFVRIGTNVVQLIFGLAGSLALLFFIYGGIMWVISGGNPDRVKKGLDAIKNAVIGLIIIFASYMIINFVMTSLGYKMNGGVWNTTPSGSTTTGITPPPTSPTPTPPQGGCCLISDAGRFNETCSNSSCPAQCPKINCLPVSCPCDSD